MNKKIIGSMIGASLSLMNVYAQETTALTNLADVDPNGTTSSCTTLSVDLRYKMKSDDVTSLQDFLIASGSMQGESTGYFGAGTLKAIKLFQQRQGLSPTGFVGPLTRAKINTLSCTVGSVAPAVVRQDDQAEPEGRKGQGSERGGTQGQEGKSTLQDQIAKQMDTILSTEDKATLKTKEEALKALKDALKTYYASTQGKDLTDATKAELKTKTDAVVAAEKDIQDTRKTIFEKAKSSMTDAQKKTIEAMMSHVLGAGSSTAIKKFPMMRGMNGSTTMPKTEDDRKGSAPDIERKQLPVIQRSSSTTSNASQIRGEVSRDFPPMQNDR